MKILKQMAAVVLATVCILMMGTTGVSAAVYDFTAYNLKFSTPKDMLVMSRETSKYDEVWTKAGVMDPSAKLDEFKNMDVVASFYDPTTRETVNFIVKRSEETVSRFNFLSMSEASIVDYVTSLMGENEDVELSVGIYPHPQTPFFRMQIDMLSADRDATEVIYGTIMNGQMIQFDMYHDGPGEINETVAQELIGSLEFTQILTREEYDAMTAASLRRLLVIVLAVIVLFAVLIFFSRKNRKKNELKTKNIAEEMKRFRERRRAGEVEMSARELFTATAVYDKQAIDTFIIYDTWLAHFFAVAASTLLVLGSSWIMFKAESTIFGLVILALGVIMLYSTYNRGEKHKEAMIKQYDAGRKPQALYRFYKEYITVTGLGSQTEYIYAQITAVRRFRGYIYLYTGDNHAMILDSTGQEAPSEGSTVDAVETSDPEQIVAYVKGRML